MASEPASIGAELENDHRAIDGHFAVFAAGLASGRILTDELRIGSDALRHHIWVEEEFHFPPLRAAGLMGPILVMLREHGEIWDLLDGLDELVALQAGADALIPLWTECHAILEQHNLKEERILYPAGDGQLDAENKADISWALAKGTRPGDWVCEMSGR